MKTKLFTLLAITAITGTDAINAQTPFPANITVGIAKPGTNSASNNYTIYTTTEPANGNYIVGTSFTSDRDINGIGLNSTDNFVYGAAYQGSGNTASYLNGVSLRRIGQDGVMVDLGYLPTSGQCSVEFPNFSAGTVGTDNTYFYTTIGLKPSGVSKISSAALGNLNLTTSDIRLFFCWVNNLSEKTANAGAPLGTATGYYELDFSEPSINAGINAFLSQVNANYPAIYNADGGIQDIAINPIDKQVYGYISYPQGGTTVGRPVVMGKPATNGIATVTPVGTMINTVPGQEISGVSFDNSGNFYGLFTTGLYATINLTTGGLDNTMQSDFATLGGNLRGDLGSSTSTPLAVKLISFTGKNNGVYNQLNWSTASEQNSASFEVERSADSKTWSNIGTVRSKSINEQSNAELDYNFEDNTPAQGFNYYRLKQIETNGKFAYSNVVNIEVNTTATIVCKPNPVKDQLTVTGLTKGATVAVYNAEGKLVYSGTTQSSVAQIAVANLASGTYFLKVANNGKAAYSTTIVKE